jgi:hypothetical protein
MELDFESKKSVTRTFYCSNKLWKALHKKTADCISVSTFIKQAIIEKMIKEDPDGKEYYEELV